MQSKRIYFKALFALVLTAAGPCFSAEPEAPPKTLEDQVSYLQSALSESLRLRDFAMLELAVKGFKAANLTPKDLEMSILRAERDAAWANGQTWGMQSTPAASMETWGLMVRAQLGQEHALAELRKIAADLGGAAPEPLPAPATLPLPEYQKLKKNHDAYTLSVTRRGYALLALALLKEPGVQDQALAAVETRHLETEKQGRGMGNYGGGTDPAILAVLAADAQGQVGWGKLLAYCLNEKGAVKEQAAIMAEVNHLITNKNSMGIDEKFSITGQIRQLLPRDAQAQLIPAFVGVLKRYSPDLKQGWDNTLTSISNIGMTLPQNALPPEGVAALEALTNKLAGGRDQYPKQNFYAILKRNGKDVANTPVKPPKVPEAVSAPIKSKKPPQDNTPVKPPRPPPD